MPKRIALGGIIHETNTFAPVRTPLDAFTVYAGRGLVPHIAGSPSALGGSLQTVQAAGDEVVPLIYAAAVPSGTMEQSAYTTLLEQFLDALNAALPVDGVLLALHGAMVAEGQDDCEGEILARVRQLVGPGCPIVSTLDMHGNLSQRMVDAADVLVAFNENPHLDTFERGVEAAHILQRMLAGESAVARALVKPPLLLSALTTWTAQLPLIAAHARAAELRQDARVANISILGGFAYADVADSGVSALVTTWGDDADASALAQGYAQALADLLWANRQAATNVGLDVSDAVARAVASEQWPVVLADVGDNIGGGSPGDGTILLEALMDAAAQDVVVVIADPAAVIEAIRAGVGSAFDGPVGGKCDDWHGRSVMVRGVVEALTDGHYVIEGADHFAQLYGREVNMGRCAIVHSHGIRILLTERKTPPGNLAQLRSQGLVPEQQKIIVAKSAVAFRGAYGPIAGAIFEVDTPGLCTANLRRFPHQKLRRPIYPLDANMTF